MVDSRALRGRRRILKSKIRKIAPTRACLSGAARRNPLSLITENSPPGGPLKKSHHKFRRRWLLSSGPGNQSLTISNFLLGPEESRIPLEIGTYTGMEEKQEELLSRDAALQEHLLASGARNPEKATLILKEEEIDAFEDVLQIPPEDLESRLHTMGIKFGSTIKLKVRGSINSSLASSCFCDQ